MRNLLYNTVKALFIASFVFLIACSSIEKEPAEWNTEAHVTNPKDSSAISMKRLYNAVYDQLPDLHTRLQSSYLDAATDDGVGTKDLGGKGSLENYRNGSISSYTIGSLDGDAWVRNYTGIRRANIFLEKIKGFSSSTQLTEKMKARYIAEVRALRAFYYFELIKRWGGVPIIGDQIIGLNVDINIPRSSLETCVKYILDEINPDPNATTSCYKDLMDAKTMAAGGSEYGKMHQGAALGIISRLKLYLASPLYNENNDIAKWTEAADAAKAVVDLQVYVLNADFRKLFGDKASFPNKEIIMVNESSRTIGSLGTSNSPCGYEFGKSKGLTSPSQNLVDAFLMKDGKTRGDITSTYTYDEQKPYENRDPRLSYTIFYNGAKWLKREVETFDGGLDRTNRPGMITTQTGYYLRKFLSLSEDLATYATADHHYLMIRYAEILLNQAEALNEIGNAADKAIIDGNLILLRTRAGIEAGTDNRYGLPDTYTQDEMRKIIQNERRIELAFEEHRFWDVRRWKIADQGESVLTQPVRGVEITKNADDSFTYTYLTVRTAVFEPRMYWYPMALAELKGNTKLVQNPGWNY